VNTIAWQETQMMIATGVIDFLVEKGIIVTDPISYDTAVELAVD
jgi:hypothetical protein